MDPSELFGAAEEECQSSESGWTMYLGSSIHGDDDDDDNGNRKNYYDDSDDSMASDASSGPSQQGMAHFKSQQGKVHDDDDDDDDNHDHDNAQMKSSKQVEKIGRRRKSEKEEFGFDQSRKAKNITAPSQSGSKVRKSIWMGSRK